MFSSVDFPDPLGPTIANRSPGDSFRFMPFSTTSGVVGVGYSLRRSLTIRSAVGRVRNDMDSVALGRAGPLVESPPPLPLNTCTMYSICTGTVGIPRRSDQKHIRRPPEREWLRARVHMWCIVQVPRGRGGGLSRGALFSLLNIRTEK